jgi:CBS domain-containing protein
MKARDLMTRYPAVVTPGDPLSRAAELMRDHDVGMVPVVDDPVAMRLRGVITDRDIVVRCVAPRHGGRCNVEAHLTCAPLATVGPDADVAEVMERMKEHRVHRVLVTHDGRLLGVIAVADLTRMEWPLDPLEVESVLEHLSAPTHLLAPA